ncbi:MAG: ATP-binding cassette domain-containing protein [Spirochaetales bacterium]|nr:ATP-binding cassette domain-containing protein [Spirochaetales bacterium]
MNRVFVILGIVALVAVWTAGSYWVGEFFVPPPWVVLKDVFLMLTQGHTWIQLAVTLFRVTVGFLLAFAVGTVLGIFCGRWRSVEAFFKPALLLAQGMPPLLWAIPLILILGVGHISPILVIALICLPLIAVNVTEGTKSAPRQLEEMLEVFAPGMYPKMRELLLPHLKPFFVSSLKLGIVLGIKASAVAEFFCSNNGIGFQIQAAYQSLQMRKLFSWALFLVVLVILSQYLLNSLIEPKKRKSPILQKQHPTASEPTSGGHEAVSWPADSVRDIRLERLCFGYTSGQKILQDIDLTVRPGEIAVLCGDSGVGKTTLLHVVAGLLKASSGTVNRPSRLGIVFQEDRLLPWRSVGRNAALPLLYAGIPVKEASLRASVMLNKIGLEGLEESFPDALSGGMKKRVSLARCFVHAPEAILLDEPFSGLHKEARRNMYQELFDHLDYHGIPVIIATHFPEEIPIRPDCRYYELQRTEGECARLVPGSRPDPAPISGAVTGELS